MAPIPKHTGTARRRTPGASSICGPAACRSPRGRRCSTAPSPHGATSTIPVAAGSGSRTASWAPSTAPRMACSAETCCPSGVAWTCRRGAVASSRRWRLSFREAPSPSGRSTPLSWNPSTTTMACARGWRRRAFRSSATSLKGTPTPPLPTRPRRTSSPKKGGSGGAGEPCRPGACRCRRACRTRVAP